MINTLISYPRIGLKNFELLPHSHLYSIEPIGIGTEFVESLTSYIARLATSHRVTVGQLFTHELANKFNTLNANDEDENLTATKYMPSSHSTINVINGMGKTTVNWVVLIERLTLQPTIKYLTMLPWQNILSRVRLQRDKRAWCAFCFADSQKSGEIIYEQLLWTIRSVSLCVKHLSPLVSICPHCNKQSLFLSPRARPGFCYCCDQWLGASPSDKNQNLFVQSVKDQLEINTSNFVAALIQLSNKYTYPLEKEAFVKNLRLCINLVTGKNFSAFAKLIKSDPTTLSALCKKSTDVAIILLIDLCERMNIPVETFLFKKINSKKFQAVSIVRFQRDRNCVIKFLEDSLQNSKNHSLKELASQLGYASARQLRVISPELCKQITAKYFSINARKVQCEKRHDLAAIEQTLILALEEIPPPSIESLARRLGYKTSSVQSSLSWR